MRITAENINWRVAAGELILIVVGILLALAIDSWAEQRKEIAQVDVYLNDMAMELQTESERLEVTRKQLAKVKASASALLQLLERSEQSTEDPGGLLISSVIGEGIVRESAIWQEIQMTGALRLVRDPALRSAIVSHYLTLASKYEVIDANFMPAVRDVRALAWDVMPVDSIGRFMQTKQTGVPAEAVLQKLRTRNDSAYLLKRLIATSTVAGINIDAALESTRALLGRLE